MYLKKRWWIGWVGVQIQYLFLMMKYFLVTFQQLKSFKTKESESEIRTMFIKGKVNNLTTKCS